jgi:hypothetical protein
MRRVWVAVCLAAVAFLATVGVKSDPSQAAGGSPVDIELAFDTTESMTPSLERARQDAQRIVEGVRQVAPQARFGVVSFRDPGNPGGEYQTLQPLTTDSAAVLSALGQLHVVANNLPSNLPVESYNLAFHRSYADDALRWRPAARKLVVVVGDAEPYGGGRAGIPGCLDTHQDPDGLNTATELAGMRAAGRTLVMVREISRYTSASLSCYQAMVGMTYPGGAARDGNTTNLVTPLLALLRGAVAPITISPVFPFVRPGTAAAARVTISNPNGFPLKLNTLTITATQGFGDLTAAPAASSRAGNQLTWTAPRTLQPHAILTIKLTATAGSSSSRLVWISALGTFQLPGADAFTSTATNKLYVTRRIAVHTAGITGKATITGGATVTLPASSRALAGTQPSGHFLLTSIHRVVLLRPYAYKLGLHPGRATARFLVKVAASHGTPDCPLGTHGTLTVTDHSFGAASGNATIQVTLPADCSIGTSRWFSQAGAITPSA